MNVATQPHPPASILAAFSTGKLDDADFEAVASHLEACAECRAQVESQGLDSFVDKVQKARSPSPLQSIIDATACDPSEPASAPTPSELPPELANHPKYEIRKQLGRGGMGTVYLAHDRDLDRDVAIKVMSPDMLARANALERFLQEAKSAAKLPPHPNVVQVYSLEHAGPLELIVMEYVRGIDLEKYVRDKGPLPVAMACYFLKQAAMGLQHAFEHGLVHRDVKPNNLIVNQKGHLKILDFGLAKPAQLPNQPGLTGDQAIMGTVEYMAPEQAMSARDVDIRADLYSLGCTAYYLLTGRPPFVDEEGNTVGVLLAHQTDKPPRLHELRPEVPLELSEIIGRLITKLPQERFQKPVELAQALTPFVKQTTAARPAPKTMSPATGQPQMLVVSKASTMGAVDTGKLPVVRTESSAKPDENDAVSALAFDNTTMPKQSRLHRPYRSLKWVGIMVAGLVAFVLTGIVIYVETDYGIVKIELSDAKAKVEILVDGSMVITDLDKTYQLKPGEHELVVKGNDFQAVTKAFSINRGDRQTVHVKLIPTLNGSLGQSEAPRDQQSRISVVARTAMLGGSGGGSFTNDVGYDALLIGLSVTKKFYHRSLVVGSIEAHYQLPSGKRISSQIGQPLGEPTIVVAKPGYAVGGLKVKYGDAVDAVKVVFMRMKGDSLDATDSYESEWLGTPKSGLSTRVLGGDGKLIIGVFGRVGNVIDAVGLITLDHQAKLTNSGR